jgi:hypothetical protein
MAGSKMATKTASQLNHLIVRRTQLLNHIEFLQTAKSATNSDETKRSIMTQILQAESELEISEKYMISLGWGR